MARQPPLSVPLTAVRRCTVGAALFLGLGCGGAELAPAPAVPDAPPNVLLIVVDTLRVDRVGAYGGTVPTPGMDGLAARGLRYEHAYATSSWTLPSTVSIYTGQLAGTHGVTNPSRSLAPAAKTLAEHYQASGWLTAGVVSNILLGNPWQLDQGFSIYDASQARSHQYISTPSVTKRALAMLELAALDPRPFFMVVHYYDAHYDFHDHGQGLAGPPPAGMKPGQEVAPMVPGRATLPAEQIAYLGALYDEEVAFVDRGISVLDTALGALGLRENTLVVLVSDHGEEFMEHGWLGHTRHLYQETVRVPLVLAGPGVPVGQVETRPVSIGGVAASALALTGQPPTGIEADIPALPLGPADPAPPVLIEVDYIPDRASDALMEGHASAVISGTQKLIVDRAAGTEAQFDLAVDPLEQDPQPVDPALRALLMELRRTGSARPAQAGKAEVSDRQQEQLRELGYVP